MAGQPTKLEQQLSSENIKLREKIMELTQAQGKMEQWVWDCKNLLDEVARTDPMDQFGNCVFCRARVWMNGSLEMVTHEKSCLHGKIKDFLNG